MSRNITKSGSQESTGFNAAEQSWNEITHNCFDHMAHLHKYDTLQHSTMPPLARK